MTALDEYINLINKNNKNEEDAFIKLKVENENNPLKVEDNIITQAKAAFVFSCPGREEMLHKKVCYGKTGENLDILLRKLNEYDSNLFPEVNRYRYVIINATNIVHYIRLDKKTEGSEKEIETEENKNRINTEIKKCDDLQIVILFGAKAKLIKSLFIDRKIIIVESCHLSLSAINRSVAIQVSSSKSSNKTDERLETIAKTIIENIDKAKQKTKSNKFNLILFILNIFTLFHLL